MKKIFTAALLTTITAAAMAQSQGNSAVRVVFTDNSPISISVDGRYYDDKGSSVLVDNLTSGSHTMIVYRGGRSAQQGGRPAVVKEMTLRLEPNVTTTYSVGSDGYTTTSRDPYPANGNDRGYDNRGGNNNNGYANNEDRYEDRNDNRGGHRSNNRNDEEPQNDDRDDRYNGNNSVNNGYNAGDDRNDRRGERRGYGRRYHRRHEGRGHDRNNEQDMPEYVMLEATDITAIKAKAQKKIKDADKLTVLKNEVGDRGFTTEQARTMLRWLKGETARLDFAKWAYQNVSDVENFPKLKTEFKLAKSKTELNNLSSGDY